MQLGIVVQQWTAVWRRGVVWSRPQEALAVEHDRQRRVPRGSRSTLLTIGGAVWRVQRRRQPQLC